MLYREIIAVCSQIHTEHINTLCKVFYHFTCAVSRNYCILMIRKDYAFKSQENVTALYNVTEDSTSHCL
jgi:hypothetical protein